MPSPADAPPSYDAATSQSGSTPTSAHPTGNSSSRVHPSSLLDPSSASGAPQRPAHQRSSSHPKSENGISPEIRRSMEDELRPLPPGWVRQYDPKEDHQFFVHTAANPPRSIWHHPLDDMEYLRTLSSEERERLQEQDRHHVEREEENEEEFRRQYREEMNKQEQGSSGGSAELPPRPAAKGGFGRKLKDKLTSTTHEEREAQRAQRAKQEQAAYEQHMVMRRAMSRAMQTGEPQLIGKDRDGKDVYIEPPSGQGYGYDPRGSFGGGGGYGYGGNGYGYNPYNQGPYANANARFIRPQNPYARPYGGGYGGGLGLPLLGGLAGGALLGGLLF